MLLDSTRRFCDGAEDAVVHARSQSSGDLDCIRWYPLRVTYCRELKLRDALASRAIDTFVPMQRQRVDNGGNLTLEYVPAIHNLVFAKASRKQLEDYILTEGDNRMTSFIWDRTTRDPISVPAKQMDDFIRVSTASADDAIYLTKVSAKLRQGTKVRVRSGIFAGVEGTVVRIKKSRRILVDIPDIISIASTYIPLDDLEIISF